MRFDMLLEEIISKSNLHPAYDRVVGNKGAAEWIILAFPTFANKLKLNGH